MSCKAVLVFIEILSGPKRTKLPWNASAQPNLIADECIRTVFAVKLVEINVSVALPATIYRIPIRNLTQERPWILRQRVKPESVDDDRKYLSKSRLSVLGGQLRIRHFAYVYAKFRDSYHKHSTKYTKSTPVERL